MKHTPNHPLPPTLSQVFNIIDILINKKNLSLRDNPQIEGFIQKMRDQAHKLSKKK